MFNYLIIFISHQLREILPKGMERISFSSIQISYSSILPHSSSSFFLFPLIFILPSLPSIFILPHLPFLSDSVFFHVHHLLPLLPLPPPPSSLPFLVPSGFGPFLPLLLLHLPNFCGFCPCLHYLPIIFFRNSARPSVHHQNILLSSQHCVLESELRLLIEEICLGPEHANVAVILLNADKHLPLASFRPVECLCPLPGGRVWRQRASLEIIYPGYDDFECRLAHFRIICHSLPIYATDKIPTLGISLKNSPPMELPLIMADSAPRTFVACPGRMFAMEQWHLFITAMELHRIHGVELVVAHILSVRDPLFDLIRLYQLDGLLVIRPSLHMPSDSDTLPYEPNSETLWSNQIADFLDCLYEFRESARFISFPDWDDLLISGPSHPPFTPIGSIMAELAQRHPNGGAFLPQRFGGHFPDLDTMHSRQMSLHQLWLDGLRFNLAEPHPLKIGKVILRPALVASVDLHSAFRLPTEQYAQLEVPPGELYFVEARDYTDMPLPNSLGHSLAHQLNTSFSAFLRRHRLSADGNELFRSLPRSQLFLPSLMECLSQIRTLVQHSKGSRCFNLRQCWALFPPLFDLIPERDGNFCVNVKTDWASFLWPRSSLRILIQRDNAIGDESFQFTRGKCLV